MVFSDLNEYQKGKTFLILVRHGDRKEGGDWGLTKKGVAQAKYVAKQLESIKDSVDVFVCSTMPRAKETAEHVAGKIGRRPMEIEGINEFNKITWTGKYYHPKFWKHYSKHRNSLRVISDILGKNRGKVVLVVGHGNVFKGFIGKKMGLSLREIGKIEQSNCGITLARFSGNKLDYLYYLNSKNFVHPNN